MPVRVVHFKVQNVPKYALHEASAQARVITLGSTTIWVHTAHRKATPGMLPSLVSDSAKPKRSLSRRPGASLAITIDELVVHYLDHAASYYSSGGRPTKECICMVEAIRHLRPLHGS